MTAFWVRAALAGAGVMALQACDLPHSQYAPYEGYQTPTSRPLAQPQYPVTADKPAPAPRRSDDPHDPVAQPSGAVTGQPLPPPGPSSANRPVFIDADYVSADPVFLTDVAYRHSIHRGHAGRHTVHVSASGRLEKGADSDGVTVGKGDTVNSLAEKYGSTREAILEANHIRGRHALKVGSTLTIPGKTEAADESGSEDHASESHGVRESRAEARAGRAGRATSKPHEVGRGETLYSLGRKFHVSPGDLAEANGLPANARLHVGQSITLPGQQEAAEAMPAPSRREVAEERRRGRERAHGRFRAPLAPDDTAVAGNTLPYASESGQPVRPTRMARGDIGPAAPSEPVPYDSLPGHLIGPAEGGFVAPPQRSVASPPAVAPVSLPQATATPPDAQVVMAGRGRFVWPVHGMLLSGFGPKPGGQRSDGIDIGAADGSPVHAAATGDVVYAGDLVPGLGNLVLIKHDDGWITAYAHLSRTEVKIKDHVLQGAEIGLTGQTGGAVQPEVYFEIRYAPTPRDKAKPVDPSLLLSSQ
ncbi:MAG TPA: peptidoglycan DD-metalloendopeptidase family protein [Caulobacteraceae bacterium]|nr:peptidoglycan DD-metalloendopeptidase family protein [Caulobacteraceae bacterium]